jgi:hypothetical protein
MAIMSEQLEHLPWRAEGNEEKEDNLISVYII